MDRRVAGWLICAGVALSLPLAAQAEIYRWVGADGKVRFSDKPQPGAHRVEPSAKTVLNEPTGDNARQQAYSGKRHSRFLQMAKVGLSLPGDPDRQLGTCNSGSTKSKDVEYGLAKMKLPQYFNYEMSGLGYRTPYMDESQFNREQPRVLEVSAMGRIVGLSFGDCRRRVSIQVEWSFYDHLHRKEVLELTTSGVYREMGRGWPSLNTGVRKAFVEAAKKVSGNERFRQLMDPDVGLDPGDGVVPASPAPAIAKAPQSTYDALALPLRVGHEGDPSGSFQTRVAALKAGSATIRTSTGHGSGFLVTTAGHVLTNHHVVGSARKVMVVFEDHQIEASVLRIDPERDVALLKLRSRPRNTPLVISRTVPTPGSPIYVIGTPLTEGLHHTVTAGVLSASREKKGLPYYQTDAAVKPGNSGGPVFDGDGLVVGLTVSGLFTNSGASLDVNLVIPIESALGALAIEAK